jgi:hypothetical protein
MSKHILVVFTNPVEGRDEEFNRWYDDDHIADLFEIPGIVSARRFRLSTAQRMPPPHPWRYLAIYEIETDDLPKVIETMRQRAGTDAMPLSDALQPERIGWYFEPLGPPVSRTSRS